MDPDKDSLFFELVSCKTTHRQGVQGYTFPIGMTINSISGEIQWAYPSIIGVYAYAVKITKWRDGKEVGYVMRDCQINLVAGLDNQVSFDGLDLWDKNSAGNFVYHVSPGDSLNLSLSYKNTLGNTTTIQAYGEVFALNPPAEFKLSNYSANTTGQFIWATKIENARTLPYIVTFRGNSDIPTINNSPIKDDITLVIYVSDNKALFAKEESLPDNQINIYPNPTNGIFTMYGVDKGRINIYDFMGRNVLNENINSGSIDLEGYSDGIYFVKVYDLNNKFLKSIKIVKE